MDERKRIEEKIKEMAGGKKEERLCLDLLDTAYKGLEEGYSKGAIEEVKERLDDILGEIEGFAEEIEERIGE
jgi:hypothetical protein